jgi:hypothetical protein
MSVSPVHNLIRGTDLVFGPLEEKSSGGSAFFFCRGRHCDNGFYLLMSGGDEETEVLRMVVSLDLPQDTFKESP